MASTVRITESAHRTLRDLADREHASLQTVLERAIEHYRRQRFLEAANESYAALRANGAAWNRELAERAEWDITLNDANDE
jgi:hypothetical protein